mmetsp:Transcript_39205/g.90930  ORF Transcript_39205/g.90930 Transcript_39205/m.90930 type:complete len:200 (+) Transcript_39205:653-1252(+)
MQLLLDTLPDFKHIESDENQDCVRVVHLHFEKLLGELLVVHAAGSVVVQDGKDEAQILLADVQRCELLPELWVVLEAGHELRERDFSALVRVQLVAHRLKPPGCALELLVFRSQHFLQIVVAGLRSVVDDDGEDHVHDREAHHHKHEGKKEDRERLLLNDGYCHETPAVPHNDLLREGEHGLPDGGKGSLAPVTLVVNA